MTIPFYQSTIYLLTYLLTYWHAQTTISKRYKSTTIRRYTMLHSVGSAHSGGAESHSIIISGWTDRQTDGQASEHATITLSPRRAPLISSSTLEPRLLYTTQHVYAWA